MNFNCNKHNERKLEQLKDNKIFPYCLSCEVEHKRSKEMEKFKEEMLLYNQNLLAHNSSKNKIVWTGTTFLSLMKTILLGGLGVLLISAFLTPFVEMFLNDSTDINNVEIVAMKVTYSTFGILYILFIGSEFFGMSGKSPKPFKPVAPSEEFIKNQLLSYEVPSREREVKRFKQDLLDLYKIKTSNIESLDLMDGFDFEEFIAKLFSKLGYQNIKLTKKTGDQGVDLFVESTHKGKIAVQCKRHATNNKVGNSAIQEVYTAKDFFKCSHGMVVTTSHFTQPAKDLANQLGIELWDRERLISEINSIQDSMTWEEFLKSHYEIPITPVFRSYFYGKMPDLG